MVESLTLQKLRSHKVTISAVLVVVDAFALLSAAVIAYNLDSVLLSLNPRDSLLLQLLITNLSLFSLLLDGY